MERLSVQYGMPVRTPSGRRVGSVALCGPEQFTIRRRLHRRATASARYDDIASLSKGTVWLRRDPVAEAPQTHEGPLWGRIHPLVGPS